MSLHHRSAGAAARVAGLVLLYLAAWVLAIGLTREPDNAAIFWPANALLLGGLLRLPVRERPLAVAAAGLVGMAAHLLYGDPPALALEPVRDGKRAYMAGMQPIRERAYPSDVSDEEWNFVAPYLALLPESAPQRGHPLREVFNALKWLLRAGAPWRMLPHDFPPWWVVHQQAMRWVAAGVFEAMIHDLRLLLRDFAGRKRRPSAAILDSRTLQSTPESGQRAGWDGAKRRKGSKLHLAVDTLGHLLAVQVTPADEQDRAQVERLAAAVQAAAGESVELAYVDQGYAGEEPAASAKAHGIRLEVVKHAEAKRGFVLLPRRWVVERSFAWAARCRRLAKDYERLPAMLAGLHFLAFACLMVQKSASLLAEGP